MKEHKKNAIKLWPLRNVEPLTRKESPRVDLLIIRFGGVMLLLS